jgi:hypothetical protein
VVKHRGRAVLRGSTGFELERGAADAAGSYEREGKL